MSRKDDDRAPKGIFFSQSEDGIAIGAEVGHAEINGKLGHVIQVHADSVEATNDMRRELEKAYGAEPSSSVEISSAERHGSTFGFSGNWAGSNWEPIGPKPNWRTNPPKDPHAN